MKKDFFALAIIVFLVVILASGTKIQSVEDYELTHLDDITADSETVFLSVNCSTLLGYNEEKQAYNWDLLDEALRYDKYVPSGGEILPKTEYVLRKGDSVFDTLNRAMRHNKIHIEYSHSVNFGSIYVEGINQLYEFSAGELSGWMYMVNGDFPNYGCSKYILKDGDVIEWVYTCDLGRDVGADWLYEES